MAWRVLRTGDGIVGGMVIFWHELIRVDQCLSSSPLPLHLLYWRTPAVTFCSVHRDRRW